MNPTNGGLRERVRAAFSGRVQRARKIAGLTQGQIAAELQRSGLSAANGGVVSDWERGKAFPRFDTFLALCEITNQPPAFFFEEDYAKTPRPNDRIITKADLDAAVESVVARVASGRGPSRALQLQGRGRRNTDSAQKPRRAAEGR